MKIKITKPIKVTEIGPNVLPVSDTEYEVSKGCGEVLVKREFAVEVGSEDDTYEFAKTDYREVLKLVEACKKLEDLDAFKADERATVIKAVETKKAELSA